MGIQSNDTIKVDIPMIPDGRLHKADGKPLDEAKDHGVKRPTGPTWLNLISTNIYARKYLASPINPNQRNLHKERIPPNTCINENLPYKERSSPPKNEGQFYTTIKTSKPSQTKVHVIF